MTSDKIYWAAAPTEEIGQKLFERVQGASTAQLTGAVASRLRRAYLYAYGLDPSGVHATSQVLRGGEAGELAEIRVNHARSLVNTLLNLISAPKVVWSPKATSLDYDSLKECDLARAILEYYWTEQQVSHTAVRALEEALYFGEGFVLLDWDTEGGSDYAAIPGETPEDPSTMMKSGDVSFHNVSPWDITRDPHKTAWEEHNWIIVTKRVNKYDLMAKYPEQANDIWGVDNSSRLGTPALLAPTQIDTDDVLVYHFYHNKTPALPNGRETVLLSSKTVLSDTDLRFAKMPLYRVSAGEMSGSSYGYTAFFDVLGIQELMDSLQTIAASNQSTFAGQIVVLEEGSEITPEQIGGGMRVIYKPSGATDPHALELCKTPAELFAHLGTLKKEQELVFGLNGVVRGEPPPGGLSGSALALLQSQALQQSSTVQSNYLRLIEGLGTGLVEAIKKFASVPQKIALVGKSNSSLVQEQQYTGESLGRICRVQVEIGNPLAQTAAGRVDMAKELIGMKLVQTLDQYEMVLSTGRLEPLTQGIHHELLLIRSENEQLSQAQDPVVSILDNHTLHVREHKVLISSPEIRKNPQLLAVVLKHIDEHVQSYYSAPAETLIITGQPLPPPRPGMMPPGASPAPGNMPPGASPAPHGPPPGPPTAKDTGGPGPDGGAPPAKVHGTPNGSQAQPTKLPSEPKNPATGQRWNPQTGGGIVPPITAK